MVSFHRNPNAPHSLPGLLLRTVRRVWSKRVSSLPPPLAICLLPAFLVLLMMIVGPTVHSQAPTANTGKATGDRTQRLVVPDDPAANAATEITDAARLASTRRPAAWDRGTLPPMAAEMRQVMETEEAGLRELHDRFRQASDPEKALAIQREIEAFKVNTELELLRIQAAHARSAGRVEAALRIESVIERILNPVVPKAPAGTSRPEPRDDETRGEGEE